jgi:hypothetical protein
MTAGHQCISCRRFCAAATQLHAITSPSGRVWLAKLSWYTVCTCLQVYSIVFLIAAYHGAEMAYCCSMHVALNFAAEVGCLCCCTWTCYACRVEPFIVGAIPGACCLVQHVQCIRPGLAVLFSHLLPSNVCFQNCVLFWYCLPNMCVLHLMP